MTMAIRNCLNTRKNRANSQRPYLQGVTEYVDKKDG